MVGSGIEIVRGESLRPTDLRSWEIFPVKGGDLTPLYVMCLTPYYYKRDPSTSKREHVVCVLCLLCPFHSSCDEGAFRACPCTSPHKGIRAFMCVFCVFLVHPVVL